MNVRRSDHANLGDTDTPTQVGSEVQADATTLSESDVGSGIPGMYASYVCLLLLRSAP